MITTTNTKDTSVNHADDTATTNTDIDADNVTKDSDSEKLEMKQVSQKNSICIVETRHVTRHYDSPPTTISKDKLPTQRNLHTKEHKPVVSPHHKKRCSHQDKLRNHIDHTYPNDQCHQKSITYKQQCKRPLFEIEGHLQK